MIGAAVGAGIGAAGGGIISAATGYGVRRAIDEIRRR